jgi:hypothetical protein
MINRRRLHLQAQQKKLLRLMTTFYLVRNVTLHNDLVLGRLEVFFLHATSVSFERVSRHPNYKGIQELTNPGEGRAFEGPRFSLNAHLLFFKPLYTYVKSFL